MKNVPNIPEINKDPGDLIRRIKYFALDLDGTIYLGKEWIDGAVDFLHRVKESGRKYYFLTNNSSRDPETVRDKLISMGLETDLSEVITSGQAAVLYLKRNHPGRKVFLLGNPLLRRQFESEGICLTGVNEDADVAVGGFDTTLDYVKMKHFCDLVRSGAPYIMTHPDINCPTEDGFMPDAGAIMAFVKASAGREPDRIIGKPYSDMSEYLFTRIERDTGSRPEKKEVAVIGDRLYTDIASAKNYGMTSVLVLSGETSHEDITSPDNKWIPDLIFESVASIRF
ncbi:MAG: HAD-IIA family hydrolase [Lachnospiraceae bacterium]|nr:HAD-IIA family hydrolase [Lachnospiraceae bacterium]